MYTLACGAPCSLRDVILELRDLDMAVLSYLPQKVVDCVIVL